MEAYLPLTIQLISRVVDWNATDSLMKN